MFLCLFVYHFSILFPFLWHLFHYDLLLCSVLMPVRICWLSSAPNCVARFNFSLDYLTVLGAVKKGWHLFLLSPTWSSWRYIPLPLIFSTATSYCFLYIPPRVVLVTVYFFVGLCALLGDVGVSLSAHLFHLTWVESFLNYWQSTPFNNGPLECPRPRPLPRPWPLILTTRLYLRPSTADTLLQFPLRPWSLLSLTTPKASLTLVAT